MEKPLPFKISVLIYLRDQAGRLLLIHRNKRPNQGLWSCIGGKLDMARGESPHEAALRETKEEIGLKLAASDLHLFSMFAEKNYEGETHWLMFLYDSRRVLDFTPPDIDEGRFAFHTPEAIAALPVPATDRQILWPLYFKHRQGFTVMRADCNPTTKLEAVVEEQI